VDIVLVSSAAPHYIIGPAEIQAAQLKRRKRTLCLIDISVPRNVDPAVHQYEDTFLYDIDDLEEVARDGRREREAVAARWRPKLAEEARELLRCLRDSEPRETAKKLLEHAAALRIEILAEHTRGLDPKSVLELGRALERLQGKLLHGTLETLKQAAREGGGADASSWVSRLFRLQLDEAATVREEPALNETPIARTENRSPQPAPAPTPAVEGLPHDPRSGAGGGEFALARHT
jgi:glutamyl-tRNA reductase